MRRAILTTLAGGLLLAVHGTVAAQDENPFARFGVEKYYAGGSATVKAVGSIQIDQELVMNTAASYTSDDGQTWITFGNEDAGDPLFLFTFNPYGWGITVSTPHGKRSATGESGICKGHVDVTATDVTGDYTCPGLDSVDNQTGVAKVDVTVRFTARFK